MSGTPGKLSYGRAPARLPWKRAVLLLSAGLLLAAISRILVPKLQTWYRGPFMVHRAVGLCLQWSQPAGRIDYEEDPTLAAVDPAYAGFTMNKFGKIVGFSANPPDALLPVLFSKSGLNFNAVSNDLVFLHSVRSPTGHERLVYIAVNKFFAFRPVNGDVPRDWPSDMLDCLVIDPGSWTTPPTLLSQSGWCDRECNSRMSFLRDSKRANCTTQISRELQSSVRHRTARRQLPAGSKPTIRFRSHGLYQNPSHEVH